MAEMPISPLQIQCSNASLTNLTGKPFLLSILPKLSFEELFNRKANMWAVG